MDDLSRGISVKEVSDQAIGVRTVGTSVIGFVGTAEKRPGFSIIRKRSQIKEMFGDPTIDNKFTIPRHLDLIFRQASASVIVYNAAKKDETQYHRFSFDAFRGEVKTGDYVLGFGQSSFNLDKEGSLVIDGSAKIDHPKGEVSITSGTISNPNTGSFVFTVKGGGTLEHLSGLIKVSFKKDDDQGLEVTEQVKPDGSLYKLDNTIDYQVEMEAKSEVKASTLIKISSDSLFSFVLVDADAKFQAGTGFQGTSEVDITSFKMAQDSTISGSDIQIQTGLSGQIGVNVSTTTLLPEGSKIKRDSKEIDITKDEVLELKAGDVVVAPETEGFKLLERDPEVEDDQKAISDGIVELSKSKNLFGFKANILIAPEFSNSSTVSATLQQISKSTKSIAVVEFKGGDTDDEALEQVEANKFVNQFNSSSVFVVYPYAKFLELPDKEYGLSSVTAGRIVATDAEDGYWVSPSNKTVNGIKQLAKSVSWDISDPNTFANSLNKIGIATYVREGGWRLWGGRTQAKSDNTLEYENLYINVRRTNYATMESITRAHLWAVDRNIGLNYFEQVTETIQDYLNDLKAQGAILSGTCIADPDRNSVSQAKQGTVYFRIEQTFVPPAEKVVLTFKQTPEGIQELLSNVT